MRTTLLANYGPLASIGLKGEHPLVRSCLKFLIVSYLLFLYCTYAGIDDLHMQKVWIFSKGSLWSSKNLIYGRHHLVGSA